MKSCIPRIRLFGHRFRVVAIVILAVFPLARGGAQQPHVRPEYTAFAVSETSTTSRSDISTQRQPDGPKVSIDVHDAPIGIVLQQIATRAGMALGWSRERVPLSGKVTVTLHDVSVWKALAIVLKGTGADAKLSPDGQTIVLVRHGTDSESAHATGTVTGRVADSASGRGLSGATIKVQGTAVSAVTNDAGAFVLRNVPAGDQVLSVRLFGYRPVTRVISVPEHGQITARFMMNSVPAVLSGVVTTATGTQRKVEVGNDITTINADSVRRVASITSMTDLLETRVPGLTIQHTSGIPGNPSRVRIRGVTSISGNNDPIIIVDGIRVYSRQSDPRNDNLAPASTRNVVGDVTVPAYAAPSPLDQIDPASIETIEVLKGPSASALYGSDAANGVIVITTKHGRVGPTHWTLQLTGGLNWLPGRWPVNYFGLSSGKFGYGVIPDPTSVPLCDWYDPRCTIDSVVAYQALNDPRYTPFTHGNRREGSLSISGGNAMVQYSLSGNISGTLGNLKLPAYQEQVYDSIYGSAPRWMLRPATYQTAGFSGNLTVNPTPTFRVTFQSSLFGGNQQQSSLTNRVVTSLASRLIMPGIFGTYNLGTNPLVKNYVERVTDAQQTAHNALSITWHPITSWQPITTTFGISTNQRNDKGYIPYGINPNGEAPNNGVEWKNDSTGYYSLGHGESQVKTVTAGTNIPMRLVTTAVGFNWHEERTTDFQAYTKLLAPGVSSPSSLISQTCPYFQSCYDVRQATQGQATYGWYVEPRLNLHSRFFVSPGFRLDGGSTTGAQAGLTGFPKIDLSYIAIDESNPKGPVSILRPRIAFGYAGTQPSPTSKLRLINGTAPDLNLGGEGSLTPPQTTCGNYADLNGTSVPTACINALGNTQLRPERSGELEVGMDLSLWQNRLQLTWTSARKTRKDAIIRIPVAPSVYSTESVANMSIAANVGEVRETSTEMTINATVWENRQLSWSLGTNLSAQHNLLVHLNPGQQPIVIGSQSSGTQVRITPGYPLSGLWARPIVGFADVNHDGWLEGGEIQLGDSAVYVGAPYPNYQMNAWTTLALLHGTLNVTASFDFQNGLTQNNVGFLSSGAGQLLGNAPGVTLAQKAAMIVASGCCRNFTYLSAQSSDYGVIQTVNTLRFNTLSIGYNVPQALSRLFGVPKMQVVVQGSNLGLHTNYRGKDPNVNAFSTVSSVDQTVDLGQIPQPRTWNLTVFLGN